MILDYTAEVVEEQEELHEDFFFPLSAQIQTGFFADVRDKCKYCRHVMDRPIDEVEDGGGGYDYVNQVFACPECGWWYERESDATYVGEGDQFAVNRHWFGVLRKYDADALDVPVASLRMALAKKQDLLTELHPSKLEELVGAVLKDHLGCEVRHVGRSGDGGIDLFLIASDRQWVVQVKRRQHPDSPEGVRTVRELVGAMAVAGERQGIFVTTAGRFTRGAHATVARAALVGAVTGIELIDMPRFIDLCELTSKTSQKPWEVARAKRPD